MLTRHITLILASPAKETPVPEPQSLDVNAPLEILCEDGPLLAVNKPAGLPTQGVPAAFDSLETRVRNYLKTTYQKPGNVYLGIPHRLDRPVSGVVVFAKNSKAAARLAEQFRERTVTKIYHALVAGIPPAAEDELVDWLRKIPDVAKGECVPPGSPDAKEARLRYKTLSEHDGQTLLEVELLTGRMHQIRLQFAARGWPIVGDTLYGAASVGDAPSVEPAVSTDSLQDPSSQGPTDSPASPPWIALHAARLTLKHPIRYDTLSLTAPYPPHWPLISP